MQQASTSSLFWTSFLNLQICADSESGLLETPLTSNPVETPLASNLFWTSLVTTRQVWWLFDFPSEQPSLLPASPGADFGAARSLLKHTALVVGRVVRRFALLCFALLPLESASRLVQAAAFNQAPGGVEQNNQARPLLGEFS
ncbi:unnamed protein product [Linum trigynum]|uniref:Uncharacterized protein n=1 Tax=Linum trigynum TaxID=586398 RepID=A0AAV2D7P0_9ROSI